MHRAHGRPAVSPERDKDAVAEEGPIGMFGQSCLARRRVLAYPTAFYTI